MKTLTTAEYLRAKKKMLDDYERQRWENDDAAEFNRLTKKYTKEN